MRTTVTLDDDVEQQIRRLMRERGSGFKETVNELLRRGLRSGAPAAPYEPVVFHSGTLAGVDLDHALRLAGALEDAEPARKFEMGESGLTSTCSRSCSTRRAWAATW